MNDQETLFALLRSAVTGETPPDDTKITPSMWQLAKRLDLAHLTAYALQRAGRLAAGDPHSETVFKAVWREAQLSAFLTRVRETLTAAGIIFVPLKGAVIRTLYPEPWMRTSCDVDVLVHEEDLDRAVAALTAAGLTTDGVRDYHDVSLYEHGMHLELHFNVQEDMPQLDRGLSTIWAHTVRVSEFEYRETPAFFAFHHLAHMAYHICAGGCGVRPFLDLYLMKKSGFYREEDLLPLLDVCDLRPFYRTVSALTDVWFANAPHTEVTALTERYVLAGGVYGTRVQRNTVGAAQQNGRIRYLWHKAFPTYETMCFYYPSLWDHRWRLPFYYLARLWRKLFGRERGAAQGRIQGLSQLKKATLQETKQMLTEMGLQ